MTRFKGPLVVLLLFLPAGVSSHAGRYLLVTDGYNGSIIWHRLPTNEACEEALKGPDPDLALRCTT